MFEYLPYPELEARFTKLNKIARPIYPTSRPNIAAVFIFTGLFVAAAVGIARSGRSSSPPGFQIMGQTACFILPVLVILWIRLRKDSSAKARKHFKRRSQKLLRTWTAQDTVTHAIQWKIRQRSKSQISQWGQDGTSHFEQYQQHHPQSQLDADRGSLDLRGSEEPIEGAPQPAVTTQSTVAMPRQIADVYTALRRPTTNTTFSSPPQVVVMMTPAQLQQQQQQTSLVQPEQPSQPSSAILSRLGLLSRSRGASRRTALTDRTSTSSTWEPWKELIRDLSCCSHFFREPKIWAIEISIRDGAVDEYALPVPSPVYCDYRLPGYEDVMGLPVAPAAAHVAAVSAGGGQASSLPVARYVGQPPAYESDSDDDSVDGDADLDDDDNEDHDGDSTHSDTTTELCPSQQQTMEMMSVGGAGSVILEMTAMSTVASFTTVATLTKIPGDGKEEIEGEDDEKGLDTERSVGAPSSSKREEIEE
ncbi:hypothetical protein BGZ83_002339 [Gryganskiella cystojenkinii]|nr:hypothetical protein BGZ83_002339 [Gryganskiella cystojenkinii]